MLRVVCRYFIWLFVCYFASIIVTFIFLKPEHDSITLQRQITLRSRVSTGLPELDRILGGGYPSSSLILVCGNPGTGKTIFSNQFLYEGMKSSDEKGMYVSFAEGSGDYYENASSVGLDMRSLEAAGKFKFLDLIAMQRDGMQKSLDTVVKTIIEFKPKRLVIDSISAVLQTLGTEDTRTFLHSLFGRIIKGQGVTTFLIGEVPYGTDKIGFGVEEFIADGVIMLRATRKGTLEKREIEVSKMRGCSVERASFEYLIDKNYGGLGIIVLPTRGSDKFQLTKKLSSGNSEFNKMLEGGFYKGSVTLVEGDSGIGKTTFCIQFLNAAARSGLKALHISLEEPVGQIIHLMQGYGISYSEIKDNLQIESVIPEAITPLHYYKLLRDILEREKPDVLAIDSVTAMQHTLPKVEFIPLMRYIQLLCKERQLTAILTAVGGTEKAAAKSGVSTLADNLVLMRYYEVKDRLQREIGIVKTRASPHDKRIVPFDITAKGIVIQN